MELLDSSLYDGGIDYQNIGATICLCHSDFTFKQDYKLDSSHQGKPLFQLGFCLEGSLQWQYPGLPVGELHLSQNQSLVQYGSVQRSISVFSENQAMRGLNIMLEKGRFETIISCFSCNGALTDLQKSSSQTSYAITPKIQMIIQDICGCGICGGLRATYLEGKVLELLAVYFDEVVCLDNVSKDKKGVSNSDYACLLKAKDIIDRKYAHPLTIAFLARSVCLNEFKLKQGFKHCFGHTIFEYIVNKRMEMANLLLTRGKHKVKDVAWMVGYSKPSNFIDVFKKRFGYTPGEIHRS